MISKALHSLVPLALASLPFAQGDPFVVSFGSATVVPGVGAVEDEDLVQNGRRLNMVEEKPRPAEALTTPDALELKVVWPVTVYA